MDDAFDLTFLRAQNEHLRRQLAERDAKLAERDAKLAARDAKLTERDAKLAELEAKRADREALLAAEQQAFAELRRSHAELQLDYLRLEIKYAQVLKQAYGPRADRLDSPGQTVFNFVQQLQELSKPTPPEGEKPAKAPSRSVRTKGRRDIGSLNHLPMIEHVATLEGSARHCPCCATERVKIGEEVTYTIEFVPGHFLRIKHVQHKFACRACEQAGLNPKIVLAPKPQSSPIDKGLPGPGLLAYIVAAKFADYLPLHRLEHIFARQGFELGRSTMCLWMADVARLLRPVYDRMAARVRTAHVVATDDTVLPLLRPGKTQKARIWIYQGDANQPFNVFDFTLGRNRDGPAEFLKGFKGVLLADAYGGYNGVVASQDLARAGCWAHARRKYIDAQKAAPELTTSIVSLIDHLFELERQAAGLGAEELLRLRQTQSQATLDSLRTLLVAQKEALNPKHPVAEAIGYTMNQWAELTYFVNDPAVPLHNNLAEQQMKRIALLRKNALFAGSAGGGEVAAILSSLTSTCRRHSVDPHAYLTQLLVNLPTVPANEIDAWLPDAWKRRQTPTTPPTAPTSP
jgi:transposase